MKTVRRSNWGSPHRLATAEPRRPWKRAAYCRRVLALAAATPNRLRASSPGAERRQGGGGERGRTGCDCDGSALATSPPWTASTSVWTTGVSVSCRSLRANAYSRNRPCPVTLDRGSDASDGKNRWIALVVRFVKRSFRTRALHLYIYGPATVCEGGACPHDCDLVLSPSSIIGRHGGAAEFKTVTGNSVLVEVDAPRGPVMRGGRAEDVVVEAGDSLERVLGGVPQPHRPVAAGADELAAVRETEQFPRGCYRNLEGAGAPAKRLRQQHGNGSVMIAWRRDDDGVARRHGVAHDRRRLAPSPPLRIVRRAPSAWIHSRAPLAAHSDTQR